MHEAHHEVRHIPFIISKGSDYDFISGQAIFPSGLTYVDAEVFEAAYERAISTNAKSVVRQSERPTELGLRVDRIRIQMKFDFDSKTGYFGVSDGVMIEIDWGRSLQSMFHD